MARKPTLTERVDALTAAVEALLASQPRVQAPVAPAPAAPVYERATKPTCSCGRRFGKPENIAFHLAWASAKGHSQVADS